YNLLVILNWIANTNVQFYTNINAIFNYVAKYVSKVKKHIKFYNEIINEFIPYITNIRNPIK
ncbi:hypothetical protein QBC45DRAFT_339983, partial [Copromyces sp. CBS 386.78]